MQANIIETSLTDHQLSFAPEKSREQNLTNTAILHFCSMKNFSTKIYKEALGRLTFPDYENFSCVTKRTLT